MDPLTHLFFRDEANKACVNSAQGTYDDGEQLIPEQRPSIIDQRAIVRYYVDGRRSPIVKPLQQDEESTFLSSAFDEGGGTCYDVMLALDVSEGCGGRIWPAAEVLGAYIAARRSQGQWFGKTVVELGAGTGLCGLLVSAIGHSKTVWITDQK